MSWREIQRDQEAAADKARKDVLRQKSSAELGKALSELDAAGVHGLADEIAAIIAERGDEGAGEGG